MISLVGYILEFSKRGALAQVWCRLNDILVRAGALTLNTSNMCCTVIQNRGTPPLLLTDYEVSCL